MGTFLLWRRVREKMSGLQEEILRRINRGKKRDREYNIFLAPIFQSYRLGMLDLKVLVTNKEHI